MGEAKRKAALRPQPKPSGASSTIGLLNNDELELAKIRSNLIREAQAAHPTTADAEQVQRDREFQAMVEKHFTRPQLDKLMEKLLLQPIDAAYLRRHLRPWLYSTALPGRLLPHLQLGTNYLEHQDYMPLERQFTLVDHVNAH
jgi:hypothetical protein